MKTEYILCAAIRRIYPRDCVNHYNTDELGNPLNDIYDIELGYRHSDILARFKDEVSRKLEDQGFYTSRGRFVDRKEAFQIAYQANQIPISLYDERGINGKLFSEDLY